ncbi:TnsA endonuclease N-terminal domain-containing protein [Photobacterium sp. J15]|uniref:TnsA endonuclease N-terminal domain-containing protein n=1 Tax=Photobacterium sp. J15 TaxID=265901 RepID=UPI0007E3400E|nr:TnsA endonuclease N-terminal domain-containing protein [Photobacterium sp. J15]
MRKIPRYSKVNNIYRFMSNKANSVFRCESMPEACQALENELNDNIIYQQAQPFTMKYLFKGKNHHYTPDFLVKFRSGEWCVLEVKPKDRVEPFLEKFFVIETLLKSKDISFKLCTNDELFDYKNFFKLNRKYVDSFYDKC